MCGIFTYNGKIHKWPALHEMFDLIIYRGPDNRRHETISDDIIFAFHRPAITGINESGAQPMKHHQDEFLNSNAILFCVQDSNLRL